MAHEHIQLLFERSMYPNLFDGHPPFQIDGNFGYTAGIAELLLQSHEEGILRVLPALPTVWDEGSVKGLGARGGLSVDMSWEDNQLKVLKILPKHDQTIQLIYGEVQEKVNLSAGTPFEWTI
jgi:alpha-L-fucosidase 2